MAPSPANVVNGVRWNTAFAYLDPVRQSSEPGDRWRHFVRSPQISSGRVTAVVVAERRWPGPRPKAGPSDRRRRDLRHSRNFSCARVSARPPNSARRHRGRSTISPVSAAICHDHRGFHSATRGRANSKHDGDVFARDSLDAPEEQTIARRDLRDVRMAFDLHIYPVAEPDRTTPTGWRWTLEVACLTPPLARNALRPPRVRTATCRRSSIIALV